MGVCRFCGVTKKLCDSHIVPEHWYGKTYDNTRRAVAFRPFGDPKQDRFVQKGRWDRLLCSDCEAYFNTEFEQPFARYWEAQEFIPEPASSVVILKGIDYARFKLFHLSVLWRAAVSKRPEFEVVRLGPHEEILRKMLQDKRPGRESEYPMLGLLLQWYPGTPTHEIVTTPSLLKFTSHRVYTLIFASCQWSYFVSSHEAPEIWRIRLHEDGTFPMLAEPCVVTLSRLGITLRGMR